MTPYYPPPDYALVKGHWKYHLVPEGEDVTICPQHLPVANVKRRRMGIPSFKLCRKCKRHIEEAMGLL